MWFFREDRGKYADSLLSAAERAKANERGLWGACKATLDPVGPIQTSPPPPPPRPPPPPSSPNCHPSYEGGCLDPSVSDYDCAGGSGNGPEYTGFVRVIGYDEYGLDADGDGLGCED